VQLLKNKSEYEILVVDNGKGISKKDLQKVTDQFYQSVHKSERSQDGLGLGLAISKNIAELHGGHLSLESAGLGKGTTAKLSLPVAAVKTDPPRSENKKMSSDKSVNDSSKVKSLLGMRVLLVEDTIDSARFIQLVLERNGARVMHVFSAKDGLVELELNANYDLVISDIGLPGMDGREFSRQANRIGSYSSIPFIALSAYGTKKDIKMSIESGFNVHIVKPVDLPSFVKKVGSFWSKIK